MYCWSVTPSPMCICDVFASMVPARRDSGEPGLVSDDTKVAHGPGGCTPPMRRVLTYVEYALAALVTGTAAAGLLVQAGSKLLSFLP